MTRISIGSFGPRRTWVRPGALAVVDLELRAASATSADVRVELLDLHVVLRTARRRVQLVPGATRVSVRLRLPTWPRHGYGLRATVATESGRVTGSSAIEALEGWWQSPRHAALTVYGSARRATAATHALAAWHVTVLQHYDWMWRHYRYRPPRRAVSFTDALGRVVSHEAVRAGIRAGHHFGAASLAYGAIYGAETEHVERHPEDRVFDSAGEPLSLGGTFFITDLRPGSAWRRRLLREYELALRSFAFDGIHMDTYGPPHDAVAADGEHIDFATIYPGLIEEAADRVAAVRPSARVLFNCVDGHPLEAVARAPTACLYLELWPPDRSFADVVRWVARARAAAGGRQVVIAAYAAALGRGDGTRAEAIEAVLLLGSVILAAGAYHHTIAEGDRIMVEGYYPAAVRMGASAARQLRELARFSARHVHLLSDPGSVATGVDELRVIDAAGGSVPISSQPRPGAIWARASRLPDGRRVLSLIDLREQVEPYWDAPRQVSPRLGGYRVTWHGLREPVAASPWSRRGEARPLRSATGDQTWMLPSFRRWLLVADGIVDDHAAADRAAADRVVDDHAGADRAAADRAAAAQPFEGTNPSSLSTTLRSGRPAM